MPIRQKIVTYGIPTLAAGTIALAALLHPWRAAPAPKPVDATHATPVDTIPAMAGRHAVDVVFAVDTTGSMGGLLDGAKRTVWSIATHIRQTDPNADLRIGLVAYRDIGDDYVTKDFQLTTDLDAVFAELSAYRAAGGGDTPEDVDAALDDTLHKMHWRDSAKKLVFLVGDAPPASRGDVPAYDLLAREAGDKQIVINAIRCGWDSDTQLAWQKVAQLSHGEFSTIQQDGGVQEIATPYDDKLAEISRRIDSTTVVVGGEAERGAYAQAMIAAEAAPAPAKADRAAYYAAKGAGTGRASGDIVTAFAQGKADLDGVVAGALPAELRGLDKGQLAAELAKRAEARAQAEAELAKVSQQRQEYLANHAAPADGFDVKVKAAIDTQLK
jgi:hypothetical protein